MTTARLQITEFIKSLNLEKLSPKEREKAFSMLEDRFASVVLSTITENLSKEEFSAFKQAATSTNADEEVATFVAARPRLAQIIEERLEGEYKLIRAALA